MNDLNTRLKNISDELSEIADAVYDSDDARPDSPSAKLRRASYGIDDAVAELMHAAATKYGKEIVPGSVRVLRERVA